MLPDSALNSMRVMFATPCYISGVSMNYVASIFSLTLDSAHLGLPCILHLHSESLITRGRNMIVLKFLSEESFTHLFWIDSDIAFSSQSVFRLLLADRDVAAGIYPMKSFNWPAEGVPAGTTRKQFETAYTDYPFNPIEHGKTRVSQYADSDGFVEVAEAPTVLVNPVNATSTETTLRDVEAAAPAIGFKIRVLNASTSREIDAAFATFVREQPDALFVGGDPFFNSRRVQLVHLATLHKVPATYAQRQYAEAGGLMSYGTNLGDAWRQLGTYAGRILKGAKPADLPVVQASKFQLVINHETARMLGLTVPDKLLAAADEVIE